MRRIMMCMTEPLHQRVAHALDERGLDYDPQVVLEVVAQAYAPQEAMTAGERQFLLESGAPQDSFDPERQAAARAGLTARLRPVTGLSSTEAAALLGREASNVRRSVGTGDLYAIRRGTGRERVLPDWQFAGGQPLPGLRRVLAALPDDMHPLAVEAFMLTPHEELEAAAPATWLATGGSVAKVVWLADSLSRE
jgi:hypothetical protein